MCRVGIVFLQLLMFYHRTYDGRRHSLEPSFRIGDSSGDFMLGVLARKGTVAYIHPDLNDPTFSFTVNDTWPIDRTQPSYHSTGDITLRVRPANSTNPYATYSTTDGEGEGARQIEVRDTLIAYDVTPLLRQGHGLQITRSYSQAVDVGGGFIIRVNVTNTQAYAQQLGALGMSLTFNNDWSGLDLNATAQHCSFTEPYVGQDGAWVKVTRVSGAGRILFVVPSDQGGMNAWRPLLTDPTPRSGTFEGFYEYTFLAEAYRTLEWSTVPDERLWVPVDSVILEPRASVTYGLRMRMLSNVRETDNGLKEMGSLVVKAVPGYVVSTDMSTAALYVLAGQQKMIGLNVSNSTVMQVNNTSVKLASGWEVYQLYPRAYGRVRVTVYHTDPRESSSRQSVVNMFVLPSFSTQVEKFGEFTAANQWFDDPTDPFGRAQSIMPYNWHTNQLVLQNARSFVVGLSDESGAGPGLGFAVKNQYAPDVEQVALLDLYVNNTLFGSKGPDKNVPFETRIQWSDYSIIASAFWYPNMTGYNYSVTDGWDQKRANTTWRSYNYVHPTAIYYTLYRLARDNTNMSTLHPWSWYLMQAYRTYLAMHQYAPGYAQYGLMVGSVFLRVLDALEVEGYAMEYAQMTALQQARAAIWQSLPFPFGSEFPWDSTGQEEIYLTAQRFGLYTLSNSTLQAILAYAHSVPNWGYHGSARRFWDFAVNGCEELNGGIERVLHHYGSGLNALPLMHAYDINPDDIYLLEVGIGSITGPLTNIQLNGASSMGLHADPSKLIHDYWAADYGMSFYGLASLHSAYAVNHSIFGVPVCYLCDLTTSDDATTWHMIPRDAFHRRLYIEPLGTAFALDAGTVESAEVDWSTKTVLLVLIAGRSSAPFTVYRLHVDHLASCSLRVGCDIAIVSPPDPPVVRGAFEIPVQPYPQTTTVELRW